MENFIYKSFSIPVCNEIEMNLLNHFLNEELYEHIQKYKNKIKNRKYFEYENMPHIRHNDTSFVLNEFKNKDLIQYFWLLEDGEIVFWKDHVVEVKKGDIIIFPNSWTFPFEMNLKFIS